jgi:catechol 2,3-dioxygenase-like lactoylglutathione lyase family enzyme
VQPSKAGLDAGIVASDLAASLHFYRDVLGLELVEDLAIPWGTMHRLRFGVSWLKLVDPIAAGLTAGPSGIDAAAGIRYLTFEVDDIAEVWGRLLANGAPVYHPLGPFGTKGVIMGMALDPDGNVVEVLHRPPGAGVG